MDAQNKPKSPNPTESIPKPTITTPQEYHSSRRSTFNNRHSQLQVQSNLLSPSENMSNYGDRAQNLSEDLRAQQNVAQCAETSLEARALLDIYSRTQTHRGTKIICTIGPASREVGTLKEMITAGMDVARLNFSHGDHEYHTATMNNIREARDSFENDQLNYSALTIFGLKFGF